MESAGTRTRRRRSGPGCWNSHPWRGRAAAYKPQPIDRARKGSGLGRIAVGCPHTNELMNKSGENYLFKEFTRTREM